MSRPSTLLTPEPRTRGGKLAPSRHAARRGLALFEVLITVAIIAMVSAAIGVGVTCYMNAANQSLTETNGRCLMQVAEGYRATESTDERPTMGELQDKGMLSRGSRTTDAWGQPFHIQCETEDVVVISAGKDTKFGTEEDIKVPPV